jgi:hypothetical protein
LDFWFENMPSGNPAAASDTFLPKALSHFPTGKNLQ